MWHPIFKEVHNCMVTRDSLGLLNLDISLFGLFDFIIRIHLGFFGVFQIPFPLQIGYFDPGSGVSLSLSFLQFVWGVTLFLLVPAYLELGQLFNAFHLVYVIIVGLRFRNLNSWIPEMLVADHFWLFWFGANWTGISDRSIYGLRT